MIGRPEPRPAGPAVDATVTPPGAKPAARAVSCPVCRGAGHTVGEKGGHAIHECEACSFRFVLNAEEEAGALFDADYFAGDDGEYGDYVAEERSHRRMAARYLRRLRQVGATQGRLLDVGCAAGFFLDEARRAGWQVRGVEVSAFAAGHARHDLGLDVVQGTFPAVALPEEKVDMVTFFNVLEHLPAPREVEARLRELVPPGGLVVVETWDWQSKVARRLGMEWHQYDPRYVPSYFDRPSLLALFPPPAWRLERYESAAKWISARRALGILRRKHGWPVPATVERLCGRVDVPYKLGDLVWVVLRRTSD